MTEESQQQQQTTETSSNCLQVDENLVNTTTPETTKTKEDKKAKCRPMTKVVIRRLPSTMTQQQFLEQVSPLPEYDYLHFAKADMSLGQYAFSRAYIDLLNPQDIFPFRDKFDNYVFVDAKGLEYPAVVEYAPFQRVPKKRVGKKKDLKCGTIESDPYYINFLETIKNQQVDSTNVQPKTEYSFQPSDHAPKKVTTTPLLDYLKQKKQEKQRLRDEKREEKRKRDVERKRSSKDEPVVSKVLRNMQDTTTTTTTTTTTRDKDVSRENAENKDDKAKTCSSSSSSSSLKNTNKKQEKYRDKSRLDKIGAKNFREEGIVVVKENKSKNEKDAKLFNKKEKSLHDKEEHSFQQEKKLEEKRGKSYEKMRQEKKRLAGIQKKQNVEQAFDELDYDDAAAAAAAATVHCVQQNVDSVDTCTFVEPSETSTCSKQNYKKTSAQVLDLAVEQANDSSLTKTTTTTATTTTTTTTTTKMNLDRETLMDGKIKEICHRFAQANLLQDTSPKSRIAKRRSSLESGAGESGTGGLKVGASGGTGRGCSDVDMDHYHHHHHDGACLRRHKSLDGGNDNNLQKNESDVKDDDRDKKDPRLERRIRNKDRPAMEIYRPGMGKFSKQRMEREKVNDERATPPSQSPTPASENSVSHKSSKPNDSKVRSMTFKRSVSRDM